MPLPSLTSAKLSGLPGINHGFFGRRGGVSTGIYASLNCGSGSQDDPAAVRENRARAETALGAPAGALCTVYQVHGDQVLTLDRPLSIDAPRPKADGMASRMPGVMLGILAADCVPVLFADAEARVVGACHAGWRGALAGITDATLGAMRRLGAAPLRIKAAIGPAIRQASYEVGPEFPAPFLAVDPANSRFFQPSARAGHFQFDLPSYVAARLVAAGIAVVDDLGRDTRSEPEHFFSYRRTTLAKEPDYGRQLSAILLSP